MTDPLAAALCRQMDPTPWLDGHHDAAETCGHCPALDPCRQYASQHRWSHVTLAGWRAGEHPSRPPWAH